MNPASCPRGEVGPPPGKGSGPAWTAPQPRGRTGGRPPALDSAKIPAVLDFLANNNGNVSAAHRTFRVSRTVIRAVRDGTHMGLPTHCS